MALTEPSQCGEQAIGPEATASPLHTATGVKSPSDKTTSILQPPGEQLKCKYKNSTSQN